MVIGIQSARVMIRRINLITIIIILLSDKLVVLNKCSLRTYTWKKSQSESGSAGMIKLTLLANHIAYIKNIKSRDHGDATALCQVMRCVVSYFDFKRDVSKSVIKREIKKKDI